MGLIAAFLNPLAFAASGPTPEEATSAIVRGVTRTVGNEIDEFVTEALRNNLVGLPLDLAALNLARGRDTGIPTLNEARREFFAANQQIGDANMKPYTSWADFVQSLKHPESLINFIAAYGTHSTITMCDHHGRQARRAAALFWAARVINADGARADVQREPTGSTSSTAPAPGPMAANGVTITGVDDIDFWIGGLAEEQMPFGGLLGSTFNFVFENAARSAAERRPLLLPVAHCGPEFRHRAGEELVRPAGDAEHQRDASAGAISSRRRTSSWRPTRPTSSMKASATPTPPAASASSRRGRTASSERRMT